MTNNFWHYISIHHCIYLAIITVRVNVRINWRKHFMTNIFWHYISIHHCIYLAIITVRVNVKIQSMEAFYDQQLFALYFNSQYLLLPSPQINIDHWMQR